MRSSLAVAPVQRYDESRALPLNIKHRCLRRDYHPAFSSGSNCHGFCYARSTRHCIVFKALAGTFFCTALSSTACYIRFSMQGYRRIPTEKCDLTDACGCREDIPHLAASKRENEQSACR